MILCMIVIQKEFEEQHRLEKAKKKEILIAMKIDIL